MLRLQISAKRIITDSGGLQKEAYFNRIPCVTIRNETEWEETLEYGWNKLVAANTMEIVENVMSDPDPKLHSESLFGNGNAAEAIVSELLS